MKIRVRDNLGKDVTYDREWYVSTDGKIFYYTGDIDGPLYVVDNDYTWEIVNDEFERRYLGKWIYNTEDTCMANNIDGRVYLVNNMDEFNCHSANADRIADAVERTKKYIKE